MWWDFGVAKLYSGFQIPGFQIPQPKRLRIPESQFPYMGKVSDETTEKSGTEKSKRNNEILFPPGPVIPRGERERGGSQWGSGFYGYRLKFWLFYGCRLIFFSYG